MKAEYSRRYSSTRFVALTGSESVANAKKKYFIWIAIVTTLFCITGTYLYYKIFIEPKASPPSPNDIPGMKKNWKLYNPKPFLDEFRRNHNRELPCGESSARLQAIPKVFIQQLLEKDFENIEDFINLDLVLHYENIIHKNKASALKSIFNEYQLTLSGIKNPQDFIKFLKVLKSNKLKFYAQHLKGRDLDLNNFASVFDLTEELNFWYNYLNQLNVFFSRYEQHKERNYFVNCTTENFVSFTENTQRRLWHFVYSFKGTEKKVQEINEIITDWTQTVIEHNNSSLVFYNKILLLSHINRELRGFNISSLKSASFFASHTIYLDEDVVLPGVDLTIIAPNWGFLKKIKIDLSGPDGKNATRGADPQQPGNPGEPGGNGGDFVGIGNLHEKFLLVSTNGGKGGSGQNGAKGENGVSHTFPGPPVNKPECATKVRTFKNMFGHLITHYTIYNASGCGQSGTDGGVGGMGGAGGTITLITKHSMKTTVGSNGTSGSHGKGGPGGMGGRDGCFYEVLDVDDKILHRVTRVRCLSGNVLPSGGFGKDNHNTRGQLFPPVKKNLKIHQCLMQFIRYTRNDADAPVISLLQHVILLDVNNATDIKDLISEYKFLETFHKPELYGIFIRQINKLTQKSNTEPVLAYLKSIALGRITSSKANINFYFIDLKNYLNLLKRSIKNTNKDTRELKSSLYLKQKIEVKKDLIKENLKRIKVASSVSPRGKFEQNSTGNSCEILATVEVLQILLNQTSEVKSNDLFSSCTTDSAGRKEIFPKEKRNLFRILQTLRNKEDVGGHLVQLKDALCAAKESDEFSDEGKNLLQALTDQLEHLTALYYFVEWEESENLFLKSLYELNESLRGDEEEEFLKKKLHDVMITLHYSLALDAARQNFYPFSINNRPRMFQNESTIDYVLSQINFLEEYVNKETTLQCGNHLRAVFNEKSAVGEFYYWANSEIRPKLHILFSGEEVDIKSGLINRHVFDKNFLQFTSLKLEFECNNQNDCQKQLTEILANFKIQITHSGYSYYNLNEETRVVVSERVSLEYSFQTRENKEPEIYNALYAKCQNGEIKLSPFTTWTIRLQPINEEADFKKLVSFSDTVSLRLVGSGTYIP